jgi:hypothetical protein
MGAVLQVQMSPLVDTKETSQDSAEAVRLQHGCKQIGAQDVLIRRMFRSGLGPIQCERPRANRRATANRRW